MFMLRYCSLLKNTPLCRAHINQLTKSTKKSLFLIEKIARSRSAGVMQSSLNRIDLNQFDETSKSVNESLNDSSVDKKSSSHVNYLMDPMIKSGLVTKQAYSYKDPGKSIRHQVLLMLSRFHRDFRTKNSIMNERMVEMLKVAPDYTMSMTRARTELGVSDLLFKKVYQNLRQRDVIEYIQNDLNIHRKIITVAERNVRLTEKYIKENLGDNLESREDNFCLLYKEPITSQVVAYAKHVGKSGFTQKDISNDIMRSYGRLESRNIVKRCNDKLRLIERAGWKEAGRQRHELYKLKNENLKSSLKFTQMPGYQNFVETREPEANCIEPVRENSNINIMKRRTDLLLKFINDAQE